MNNVGGNVKLFIQIYFRCCICLWIRLDSYGMFAGVFIRGNDTVKFGQHASQHDLLTTRHVLVSYQFTGDSIIMRPIAVLAHCTWLTHFMFFFGFLCPDLIYSFLKSSLNLIYVFAFDKRHQLNLWITIDYHAHLANLEQRFLIKRGK